MKTQISFLYRISFFLFFSVILNTSFAQDKKSSQDKDASIKSAIESKQFVFKVQRVLPLSGRVRQINNEGYEVRVKGDSLFSYLPYFGRAYSAPVNSSEGGINFTSVKFDYSLKNGKKNNWEILLRPKDISDANQFFLTVGEKGNASLRALSNNRQAISFDGYIEAIK